MGTVFSGTGDKSPNTGVHFCAEMSIHGDGLQTCTSSKICAKTAVDMIRYYSAADSISRVWVSPHGFYWWQRWYPFGGSRINSDWMISQYKWMKKYDAQNSAMLEQLSKSAK
jgi:hypothetical protein